MSSLTLLPEEAKANIGIERDFDEPIEIEKGAIQKYAQAIMDRNPLYHDEEHAKTLGFSGLLAPPLFIAGYPPAFLLPPIPDNLTGLHGEDEWELFLPVQAGDVITGKGNLADITEREGRSGKIVILTMEANFANQRGEQVARYRSTGIYRRKPEVR